MPGRVHESVKKLLPDGFGIHEADTGDFGAVVAARVRTKFDDPEIDKSFAAAYSHFLASCWSSSHDYMCMAFQSCESPIEVHFLGAVMICVASRENYRLNIFNAVVDGSLLTPGHNDCGILRDTSAARTGWLQVRLLTCLRRCRSRFRPTNQDSDRRSDTRSKTVRKQVIVECDGHDFHDHKRTGQARQEQGSDTSGERFSRISLHWF